MRRNSPDHIRILDTGDDPHLPTAALAALDVDAKYALQPLRPAHRPMPLGRPALDRLCPATANAAQADGDAIGDASDLCSNAAGSDQSDTDQDGYGDTCDVDFDNNGFVNFADPAEFRQRFGTRDPGRFPTDREANLQLCRKPSVDLYSGGQPLPPCMIRLSASRLPRVTALCAGSQAAPTSAAWR
jgi:Thrombospondin type 3 repeat